MVVSASVVEPEHDAKFPFVVVIGFLPVGNAKRLRVVGVEFPVAPNKPWPRCMFC